MLLPMIRSTGSVRTVYAAVILTGAALVSWAGAPILPVMAGALIAGSLLLLHRRPHR
jgi:hypothetical protein